MQVLIRKSKENVQCCRGKLPTLLTVEKLRDAAYGIAFEIAFKSRAALIGNRRQGPDLSEVGPGVSQFWSLGERQYAMRIWIDPDKAAA